jgi:transposase
MPTLLAGMFAGMGGDMRTKRDRVKLEARRLQGARLLQRGVRPAEVARRVGVSRTSVGRWAGALEANGVRALRKAPRTGRPPALSEVEKKRLVAALEAGALAQGYSTDLWTLRRVGRLIEKISGEQYSESGVWRLLRALNFSCQRPTGRATQRDEDAIRRWKKKRWPALKKTAPGNAEPSSS